MANTIHRCTDTGCPFVGQVTSKSCGCHKTAEQMLTERVEEMKYALIRAEVSLVTAIRAGMNDTDFDAQEMADIVDANPVIMAIRSAIANAGA